MTHTGAVLALLGAPDLLADTERVIAAAGGRMIRATEPARQSWITASAVIVDEVGARRCVRSAMPRRDGVILVGPGEPTSADWAAAIEIGAQRVYAVPRQETEMVHVLSEAVEQGNAAAMRGPVIAVIPGRGGGGASVFAAALSQCAPEALLIDLDPYSGGVDLLLGVEAAPGLRWPDIAAQGGRLGWAAVREALPRRDTVTVLSSARGFHDIDPRLVTAMADAGRRGGSAVFCDLSRQIGGAGGTALEMADLVVVVTGCDVRGVAASSALTAVVRSVNPNIGLVIRGPAPGGLTARDAADAVGLPLLAAMRPEPMLAQRLDRRGLRLRRRSPLAIAARRVLDVLDTSGRSA
ncbi:MAG TPA: CpaE-like family protein [Mycobacterium sp.]|nr:MAG: hypothetical protein E6Q56_07585 [Mycobacterium sp.]HOB49793.1 CpaE-like family protein [Mycobacterium sp.]HPZ94166.1 CpaE-like family protein [Mycobacterium sp.]HQE16070.1 CpaE-like family protein [Mycobacterium sp.]